MAAVHDDEPGFWPGYVAAVSGLVQGLLIMAMALATAIFALGQLARAPAGPAGKGGAGQGAQPIAAAPFTRPPLGAPRAELLPLAPPVPIAGLDGPALAAPRVAGPVAGITAGFQGDAVVLPQSAVPGLIGSLYRAQGAGVTRWRITIPADLANPREQRAAYLRLLGLRSVLVRQGIAPDAIDLWIEEAGSPGGASRNARIEPLDDAGAPLPGDPGAMAAGGRP